MTSPRITVPDRAWQRGAVLTDELLEHHAPLLAEERQRWLAARPRGALDGTTKELVRLRVASFTQCAYCNTVRLAAAGTEPVSEDLVQAVRSGVSTDVPADHRGALDVADRFLDSAARRERSGDGAGLSEPEMEEALADLVGALVFGKFRVMLGLSAAPDDAGPSEATGSTRP